MHLYRPDNRDCWITDAWRFNGLQAVILENSLLRVVILPDKGSDIVEFRYKPADIDFLLQFPGGLRNPHLDTPSAAIKNPFLDYFSGGWNDVLPNGGPNVNYKGAEIGQHGEASLMRWQYAIVEDKDQSVALKLWVRLLRTPFLIEKTLSLKADSAVLTIEERVTNEGGEPLHFMWGQHIAFGRPFLDEGAVIDAPDCRFIAHDAMDGYEPRRFQPGVEANWSMIPTPDGKTDDASIVPPFGDTRVQEMAYLAELSDGWYAITNQKRQVGFGLRFDHTLFRYIWYWQQLGNVAQGYPWWGRLHTTALEPWTSYPTNGLTEAIENGTAYLLQAGEHIETSLLAIAYESKNRVTHITTNGEVLTS